MYLFINMFFLKKYIDIGLQKMWITMIMIVFHFQIDPKYVKKIESLVRHLPRTAHDDAVTAPCPVCGAAVSVPDLVCNHCQADLPACIATVSSLFIIQCF